MEIDIVRRELDDAAQRIQEAINQELTRIMMVYQFPALSLDVSLNRNYGTPGLTQDTYNSRVEFVAQL